MGNLVKTIPLTKGYSAIVDDDDYERLSQYKWTAVVTGQRLKRVYAYRRTDWDQTHRRWKKAVYMHREIMKVAARLQIDHVNHDSLDNRKANLRLATASENAAHNRRAAGIVGLRGVTPTQSGELAPYAAQIRIGNKHKHLGTFFDKTEAACAYDAAAIKAFGKFAMLNFPQSIPD